MIYLSRLLLKIHPLGIAAQVLLFLAPIACGAQEALEEAVTIEGAIVKIVDSAKVPAEVQGVLASIAFREGQEVEDGVVLAKIKSKSLSLELERAKAKLDISRAKAENQIDIEFALKSSEVSSAKLSRSKDSNKRAPGVVSRARIQELGLEVHRDKLRVEQATRDMDLSKMELQLAQTDLEKAKHELEKADIRSPIAGVVVLVEKNVGEWAEPGETVLKIVRLDRLRLEGFITAAQVGRVKVGDSAEVIFEQDWIAEERVEGKVSFINPQANPVNSQVEVWVEIENPNRKILPGLEATIVIGSKAKTEAP